MDSQNTIFALTADCIGSDIIGQLSQAYLLREFRIGHGVEVESRALTGLR